MKKRPFAIAVLTAGLVAGSASAALAAPASEAPTPTSGGCAAQAPTSGGCAADAPTAYGQTVREFDLSKSQVMVNGQAISLSEESSWSTKPLFKTEVFKIRGVDANGKAMKVDVTFDKTKIGPMVKSINVDGDKSDVRGQNVSLRAIDDHQDLALGTLMTQNNSSVQFSIIANR